VVSRLRPGTVRRDCPIYGVPAFAGENTLASASQHPVAGTTKYSVIIYQSKGKKSGLCRRNNNVKVGSKLPVKVVKAAKHCKTFDWSVQFSLKDKRIKTKGRVLFALHVEKSFAPHIGSDFARGNSFD
jgi:hypothetical protein